MGLQLTRHEAFQRRMWRVQRMGWLFIALVVLITAAGLLGPGPLSSTTAAGANGALRVEYHRFAHLQADYLLTVTVSADAVRPGSTEFELAGEWVRSVDLDGVTPRPQTQTPTAYGLRLSFDTQPGAELRVAIAYRAITFGSIDAGARFDGDTVGFRQFVYP